MPEVIPVSPLFSACQDAEDPLTDGKGCSKLGDFGGEDFWEDEYQTASTEVHKETPCLCPWAVKFLLDYVQSFVGCVIH